MLFLSGPVHAEEALHRPQLYDHNGAPVDPLCFIHNYGAEDAPVYPTQNCEWEGLASVGEEAPLDENRFVSTAYEDRYFDPETEETFISHGFIGYRAIGHIGTPDAGYEAVVVVENGGGSGIFSSIMLLETRFDEDTQSRVFARRQVLGTGDRCMGGYENANIKDGKLEFSINTTMGDMLRFAGNEERPILKSDAAGSLPYCSICCYAVAHFDENADLLGVSFKPERMKPDEHDSEAAHCVEKLVALNVDHGQIYFPAADFEYFVREIEHVCLGRVEGEE